MGEAALYLWVEGLRAEEGRHAHVSSAHASTATDVIRSRSALLRLL